MTSLGWQNLSDMISEVGRIVGDSGTGRRRPIKDAIGRAYDAIAAAVEWPQLVAFDDSGVRTLGTTTVASLEAGEAEAPAPFFTGKLRSISLIGHDVPAIEITQPGVMADLAGSQFTASRRPAYAAQIGVTAQTLRLSTAGTILAFSTDAVTANDATHSVVVEYRGSLAPIGHESTINVTGAFSTGVTISASIQAAAGYPISKVTLCNGWKGNFQIRDQSSNHLVSVFSDFLPSTVSHTESRTICKPLYRFWPVPDQDYGLIWTWWRRPRRMTLDGDTPEIPVSSYLVAAASAEILRHMDKLQAANFQDGKAEQFVRLLLRQNNRGPMNVIPKGGNFVSMTGADYS